MGNTVHISGNHTFLWPTLGFRCLNVYYRKKCTNYETCAILHRFHNCIGFIIISLEFDIDICVFEHVVHDLLVICKGMSGN